MTVKSDVSTSQVVPSEAVDLTDPPPDTSSGGGSLCRWFLSFDTPQTLVLHGPSAHFVHFGQAIVLIIIFAANFTTSPWKSDSGAQYYFSAASKLPAVEPLSVPRGATFSGDAWRVRSLADSHAWDVAELEFKTVGGEGPDQLPVAISSGSVSDAQHGNFPGYEPDKAFDKNSASIWGGRQDAEGLWVGLEYGKTVEIASIKVMQIETHLTTQIAIEVRKDGKWHTVEEVSLLAKGNVYEDVFQLEDTDDVLTQSLIWPADAIDDTNALPSGYTLDAPVWTMEQFVPSTGHSSLFIPLSYVDRLEAFRICGQPRTSIGCSADDDCRTATGDAVSVCGGDGICLVRRWCVLPGRSNTTDLSGTLSDAQYEVIARLKPHGKKEIYSNYKSSVGGEEEVCTNCRFQPNSVLDQLKNKPGNVLSSGVELEHTFHWQCDDLESYDDRYGCNVWTDQTVTRHEFSISRSTIPVARGAGGEMLRRSVILYGMNIHFRGEGHTTVYLAHPILMMICQLFALVLLSGLMCFCCLFNGGHPNESAFEPYSDSVHKALWKVVTLKKEANPELQGLTNHRLHQGVKEDVEVLAGAPIFNDSGSQETVGKCLDALMRNNGSKAEAAKELQLDNTAIQNITEAVKVGHPHVKATMDKETNETTEADDKGEDAASEASQETV